MVEKSTTGEIPPQNAPAYSFDAILWNRHCASIAISHAGDSPRKYQPEGRTEAITGMAVGTLSLDQLRAHLHGVMDSLLEQFLKEIPSH